MDQTLDVIVVGAGAAGLAAGIFAGRAKSGLRIAALDGAQRIGAKILVSGGGRCNVTNVKVTCDEFFGGNRNLVRRVLKAFPENATRAFFEKIGVALHEEEYGKLFPDTNSAKTVVERLLAEADRCGVQVLPSNRVTNIERAEDAFIVTADTPAGSSRWQSNCVVLATGGQSLPKTGSDGFGYELARRLGHSITPTTPALDPLILSDGVHTSLSGIAHDVRLTFSAEGRKPVYVSGPMLWTHFGVSGPAALDVSRFWNRAQLDGRPARLSANLLGGLDFEKAERAMVASVQDQPRVQIHNVLRQWLPDRVAEAACRTAGVDPARAAGQVERESRRRLIHRLIDWPLPVTGTRGYNYAEVTAGGIPLSEIDTATMQSRIVPGLYLVGEIIDVDGRIGGFNFQWAWSSGYVAGNSIAASTQGAGQ